MERLRERYYLTYPKSLIREPLLYHLVKKFDLVFNIRGASVSEEMGLVAVEFEGSSEQIERAKSITLFLPSPVSCPKRRFFCSYGGF